MGWLTRLRESGCGLVAGYHAHNVLYILASCDFAQCIYLIQYNMLQSAYVPMIQLILLLILIGYCGNYQRCTIVDKPTLPLLLKMPPSPVLAGGYSMGSEEYL